MDKEIRIDYIFSGITTLMGLSLENIDAIKSLVFMILGAISFIVSISYTVYKWYKKSKQDGVVTLDEIEQVLEEVQNEISKEKNKINRGE